MNSTAEPPPKTLTDLPQEVIDEIIVPLLPSTLQIQVHEFEFVASAQNGKDLDGNDSTASAIEPGDSWRWAMKLRGLHSKFRKTIDQTLARIDMLEIDMSQHPNRGRLWEKADDAPLQNIMTAAQWHATIQKHDIKTIILYAHDIHWTRYWRGRANAVFTILKPSRSSSWDLPDDLEYSLVPGVEPDGTQTWAYMYGDLRMGLEGAVRCLLTTWLREEGLLTAKMLAELQACMVVGKLQLERKGWARKAARKRFREGMSETEKCRKVELLWLELARGGWMD